MAAKGIPQLMKGPSVIQYYKRDLPTEPESLSTPISITGGFIIFTCGRGLVGEQGRGAEGSGAKEQPPLRPQTLGQLPAVHQNSDQNSFFFGKQG